MPARGASLRRVGGRDLFDPTISLVLPPRGEQTPSVLLGTRKQPVLRHLDKVTVTTDKSPKGKARVAAPAEARVFHAVTIR